MLAYLRRHHTCGGSPCSRVIGATFDGVKVQGLAQSVDGAANVTTTDTAHITTNGAGTNDLRVVAVALGQA
jgi:hypothetical protein